MTIDAIVNSLFVTHWLLTTLLAPSWTILYALASEQWGWFWGSVIYSFLLFLFTRK